MLDTAEFPRKGTWVFALAEFRGGHLKCEIRKGDESRKEWCKHHGITGVSDLASLSNVKDLRTQHFLYVLLTILEVVMVEDTRSICAESHLRKRSVDDKIRP